MTPCLQGPPRTSRGAAIARVPTRAERGSVSLFLIVAVMAVFLAIALVVDGGGKVRSLQRANNLAAEAARAGGQAINPAQAIQGQGVSVNASVARATAEHFLDQAGVEGSVTVVNGTRLHVQVTTSYQPVFLGLAGLGEPLTTTGTAEVELVRGIEGGTP